MSEARGALAVAGLVTGVAGFVASEATVRLLQQQNGPIVAVGSAVRDLTPGDLAVSLAHLVGEHLDKPLLLAGTAIIPLGLCAWAATRSRTQPWLSDVAYFALAVIGLAAVLSRPDTTGASSVAVAVGLVVWLGVHRLLTTPILERPVTDGSDDGESRRRFLTRIGAVAVVTAGAGVLGTLNGKRRRKVDQTRRLLRLDGVGVTKGEPPAGSDLEVSRERPWRTPADDPTGVAEPFYRIDTALSPPLITPGDWSLRIHGMVEEEVTISYNDLLARSITEDWVTICCVSNEVGGDLIGNAWWSGVLIRDLLAEAVPAAGADAVLQTSADGWNCATPLAALTDQRNAMLAVAMNGEPLPIEHGFPVRMIVPGLYGYVSATKWVVDMEVTRFDEVDAYWTQRGWGEKGPIKTQSRIDKPRQGDEVEAGTVAIGGTAWAQRTGIDKVEVQVDGGPWQSAELGTVPGLDTWVQWKVEVEVGAGRHGVAVRATDNSGYTQTSVRADVLPDGATGWHSIEFDAK